MSKRPNILLILTDQQSHGAMSCAGNGDLRTPAMDSLAAAGVRFDAAYCTCPLCTPARASLLTGRWPHEVGIRGNDVSIAEPFRSRELGALLAAGGYECAYGGKWHIPEIALPEGHGFRRIAGFDDVHLPDRCREFLAARHDRPFLLVASFDNPHNICEWARNQPLPWGNLPPPPAPEECPPLPANHAAAPYEPTALARTREEYRRLGLINDNTPDDWRRLRWAYFRLVERVDEQVGRVLAASPHADDTVVVFTSDHGDQNTAHALSHKNVLYEESVRVPLIVAGAGVAAGGRVESTLVSTGADLFLTLCDLAGAAPPAGILGHSLAPVLAGRPLADPNEFVAAEVAMAGLGGCPGRMIRSARYKYAAYERGNPRESLYDLAADPGEMVNLAVHAAHRDVLARHRQYLRQWCLATGDTFGGGHYAHDAPFMIPGDAYDPGRPAHG